MCYQNGDNISIPNLHPITTDTVSLPPSLNKKQLYLEKLFKTSRTKKSLIIIGVIAIIFLSILLFKDQSIDDEDDELLGEVWGPFTTDGEVTSNMSFPSRNFSLFGYDDTCSTIEFSISNISQVRVIDQEGVNDFERVYILENQTFNIVIRRGDLYCDLVDCTINLEFREFYGKPQDEVKYMVVSRYESIHGDAFLEHNEGAQYDIHTYRYATVFVNGEVLSMTAGYYIIPDGERAHVTIRGHGTYNFDINPTIDIDGTVRFEDFTELSWGGIPLEHHSATVIKGDGIQLTTIKLPDYDVGTYYPWTIRIHGQGNDNISVKSTMDLHLVAIFVFVLSFYILLWYSILFE